MTKQNKGNKHIHFIGIGGSGVSAIARVLLDKGFHVSGSDLERNKLTAALSTAGATIYEGHDARQITGAQIVIRSSAIPEDNPEVQAAQRKGIPVLKRAEFLGSLMSDSVGIAIAGSHGKTTTTGMIAHIMIKCRLDPSVIVGGVLPAMQSNGRSGQGHHFVVEADEYDQMFLGLRPKIAVITNVDYDHPDVYPTVKSYRDAFVEFVQQLPSNGRLIVCGDDDGAVSLLEYGPKKMQRVVYGIGEKLNELDGVNVVQAQNLARNQYGGCDFQVAFNGKVLGPARLRVPGKHNVRNALAAIATTLYEGLGYKHISHSLSTFGGIGRRFEVRGQVGGVAVVDDYAHHPAEIRATLNAARDRFPESRIWAVWQPHTFSRLKAMMSEFATCFGEADRLVVLDIFRSRESNTLGISSEDVVARIQHDDVIHQPQMAAATSYLVDEMQRGDIVVIMNAGDARMMSDWVLDGLREKLAGGFPEGTEINADKSKRAKLDATAEQVRRLVAKLQEDRDEDDEH